MGLDAIVLKQAQEAIGCDLSADCFAELRLRSSTRYGGMGLTSIYGTREAAFVAACAQAVPSFADVHDRAGQVEVKGVLELPVIVARVGRDAFDGEQPPGWQQFFDSGSRVGAAMAQAAEALRARVPADYAGDLRILHLPAAALPAGGQGLQAALVADSEQLSRDALTDLLRARPHTDRQQQLHYNTSREAALFSQQLPRGAFVVPNVEWVEMCARLLGLPSPACAHIVGQPLRAVGQRACAYVGPYGDELAAAITFKGDHFAKLQHDPVLYTLSEFLRVYAGVFVKLEDADIFGSVLRHWPGPRNAAARDRKRVLTVDLHAEINGEARLYEMKTVHYCPSRYGRWPVGFNQAVEKRVAQLPAERLKEITDTDRDVFGTPAGAVGPLQQRLLTFPQGFTGIATGAFGEWSLSLVMLIKKTAEMAAPRWMDRLGAPSPAQARSTLARLMRAELGMRVARGHAKLIIARARALGGAGAEAGAFAREPAMGEARYAQDAYHHQQHQRGDSSSSSSNDRAPGRRGCPRRARAGGWQR
jgi:hypothetical protein